MTHEKVPNGEHPDGPEYDERLRATRSAVTFDTPEESDLPPLDGDLEE